MFRTVCETDAKLYEDNQGCISMAKNDFVNDRSKHVDIKYQMVMDLVSKLQIELKYIHTTKMLSDIMTK